jgi:hypothetical protein
MTSQPDEADDRPKLDVWELVLLGRSAGIGIAESTSESVAAAWGKPDAAAAGWVRYGPLNLHFEDARLRQIELEVDYSTLAWDQGDYEGRPPQHLDVGPAVVLLKAREYERFARLPKLLEWLPAEANVSFQYDPQARRVWVRFAQDNRWGHIGFAADACLTTGGLFDIDYHCATIRVGRN